MRNIEAAELASILAKHILFLRGEEGGVRADLSDANLRSANLRSANLSDANLSDANLSDANLSDANLRSANLSDANLSDANLSDANLADIREDFFAVLNVAPNEVPGLLAALKAGDVDGSTYEGPCSCLVGTIAKQRGVPYFAVEGLAPNSDRLIERFFTAIREGDTPRNNPIAKIVEQWIGEWTTARAEQVSPSEVPPMSPAPLPPQVPDDTITF